MVYLAALKKGPIEPHNRNISYIRSYPLPPPPPPSPNNTKSAKKCLIFPVYNVIGRLVYFAVATFVSIELYSPTLKY